MLHGQIWIILSKSLIDDYATFERDGYSWFTNIDNGSWMLHVFYTTFANFWKSNLDQLRLHLKDCTTFIVQLLQTIDLWNFAFILLADDRDRVSMWGNIDVLMRRELQLWYLFACPNQRVDFAREASCSRWQEVVFHNHSSSSYDQKQIGDVKLIIHFSNLIQ